MKDLIPTIFAPWSQYVVEDTILSGNATSDIFWGLKRCQIEATKVLSCVLINKYKKSLYHKEKNVKRLVSTVVLSLLWNVEPEQPFRAGAEKKMPLQLKANI